MPIDIFLLARCWTPPVFGLILLLSGNRLAVWINFSLAENTGENNLKFNLKSESPVPWSFIAGEWGTGLTRSWLMQLILGSNLLFAPCMEN